MNSIIITGANTGIGFQCALKMAKLAPNEQIILACRNEQLGKDAVASIGKKTGHQYMKCLPLDLASLKSINEFTQIFSKEKHHQISTLVNNAGIQNVAETQYTEDGFELTFGVNHLGSFALTLLLLPFMNHNARITFVSSGTHDPSQKTGVPDAEHTHTKLLAYPEDTTEKALPVGQKRYATSKLCNIMTVYQLQKHLSGTNIHVNAFAPGLVPGTGLARNYPPFYKFISNYIFKVMIRFNPKMNSAKTSGENLANLAYSSDFERYNGKYFEGKKPIKSSEDSYNVSFQEDLWETSLELTGIEFSLPTNQTG